MSTDCRSVHPHRSSGAGVPTGSRYRLQPLADVWAVLGVAQFLAVVLPDADAGDHAEFVEASVDGEFFGLCEQFLPVAAVLPVAVARLLADACLAAVDVEFADDGGVLEFPAYRVVGEAEPTEPDQEVLNGVFEADEVFGAAADLVGHDVEFDIVDGGIGLVHPDLASADVSDFNSVLRGPLGGELAEVRLPDPSVDEVRGNIALDALEPGVLRDHPHDLADNLGGLLVV